MRRIRALFFFLIILALVPAALLAGCGSEPAGRPHSSAATRPSANETPASVEEQFKFIVCGDPQNNYAVFNKILEASKSVDFLMIAGDETGSGTRQELQSFIEAMTRSGITYYCVPGNHDVATSPVSQNYTSYLGQPYRSFDYKNCHFVLIDNSSQELGFYPAEREWVRSDLSAACGKGYDHIFAVCHVPPGYPYSASAGTAQIPGINANNELAPVLSKGGVDELFCGHVHTYLEERDNGLRITITGGAGAPLMNSGSDSYYHYVLVEINGKKCTKTVVRI